MTPGARVALEALWKISGDGARLVRPNGLLDRLRRVSGLSVMDIGLAMQELRAGGEVSSQKWHATPTLPGAMLSVIKKERPILPWTVGWQSLLEQAGLAQNEIEALQPIGKDLKDFDEEACSRLIAGLIRLRQEQAAVRGLPLYDVSARYLLGASKLLERIRKSAIAFGVDVDSFAQAHKYVAVAGPAKPKAVILVENPHAFETAVEAQTDCAWACTYGFGIALGKDERHGRMLVENLTTYKSTLKTLVRSGEPPPLNNLLGHPALFFWGDLDLAGLMIFSQLRASFPQIQMSALYLPMIEMLKSRNGHPYHRMTGKDGQMPSSKVDESLAALANLCRERGVDQECLTCKQIEALAGLNIG